MEGGKGAARRDWAAEVHLFHVLRLQETGSACYCKPLSCHKHGYLLMWQTTTIQYGKLLSKPYPLVILLFCFGKLIRTQNLILHQNRRHYLAPSRLPRSSLNSKHGAYRPQKQQGLLGTGRKGEGGIEVGEEGNYVSITTLSPPEWHLH